MIKITASPDRVMQIGYEGEDNVTQIVFSYDEAWLSYGDGEFKVRVLRPGEKEAYNATDVVENRSLTTLVMTLTDIELSKKGHGEMQVVYTCANAVKKSPIYRYNVSRAIDSEIVDPPEGSIIAEVEKSLAEIKDEIGSLSELTTEDKTSLVSAINEVNAKEVEVTVDSELSAISTNPLQNKIVTLSFMNALDRLEQDESRISDNAQNVTDMQTAIQNAKLKNIKDGAGEGAVEEGNFDGAYAVSATGQYAHAEGGHTTASGNQSHAEGGSTTASKFASHAEGSNTTASGLISHAEGAGTTASGDYSHAEGSSTKAIGNFSHAEGGGTTAKGANSHAEGDHTTAEGDYSHAEGNGTHAKNKWSHAEGTSTHAEGDCSHAEGAGTIASGPQSHAEGAGTTASGNQSHAEGSGTTASGNQSHAEGGGTTASNTGSHAEGSGTTASGYQSHAEGNGTKASGSASHAGGLFTEAQGFVQTVIGKYNIPSGKPESHTDDDELFIIGNGGGTKAKSNAHTTSKGGVGWYQTDIRVGGTDHTEAAISLVEMKATLDKICEQLNIE